MSKPEVPSTKMLMKKLQDAREIIHLGCQRKSPFLGQITFEVVFDLLKRGTAWADQISNDPFLPQQGHKTIQSGVVITAAAILSIARTEVSIDYSLTDVAGSESLPLNPMAEVRNQPNLNSSGFLFVASLMQEGRVVINDGTQWTVIDLLLDLCIRIDWIHISSFQFKC